LNGYYVIIPITLM